MPVSRDLSSLPSPHSSPQDRRMSESSLCRIARALVSVHDKTGLVPLARALEARGVEIVSTGGTARTLAEAGLPVVEVASLTRFPEMLDGRVKTLHPALHGGILARRDKPEHRAALAAHNIGPIDLVVVNLYPFAATVARGASWEACIENIDIGGPSLIRAAATPCRPRLCPNRRLRCRGRRLDGRAAPRDLSRDAGARRAAQAAPALW